jgi:hypothetical protein
MADKRKAKSTKPTGQRKSARHVADKENSQTAVTSEPPTGRPRPRPVKRSAVPQHAERDNTVGGESDGDEGTAMAAKALLSIQKGKPFPAAHALSPMEHIFRQVVPGCDYDIDDGIGNVVDGDINEKASSIEL